VPRRRTGAPLRTLPTVAGTNRGAAVLDALRTAILHGEIPPGAYLRETDIATHMSVSRSPVREAIRQLQQEGLVDVYPYQGAIVAGVPNEEVPLIYGLRARIEAEAFARACEIATKDDFDHLTDLWYRMEQGVRKRDLAIVTEMDLAFHEYVVNLVSSPFLRSMAGSLDRVVRATVMRVNAADASEFDERAERDTASHLPLLDALRSRDVERARRLAYEHVDLPWNLPPTATVEGTTAETEPAPEGQPVAAERA
jgi:DNA-binding GntR family transcriptional regulator